MSERRRTILIVDDNESLSRQLSVFLEGRGFSVRAVRSGEESLEVCSSSRIDIVLLDQQLPDGEGSRFCTPISERTEGAKVIFITAYPSMENVLKALRSGAYDYLAKPFEFEELEIIIERALKIMELERMATLQTYRADKEREEAVFIGGDGGLEEIEKLMKIAASATAPVLITGETGTGKNLVAKAIHHASHLHTAGFVSVNCTTLPEHLFEAELFGYERGAFTGAIAPKRGLFEVADGGCLFLDEIGCIPYTLQSKLLSSIEDGTIRRVGGVADRRVEVRIIAATNLDIEHAIKEGRFREDLYYRLNVIRIHIPPLRDHREDIPALCSYFLRRILPNEDLSISSEELNKLQSYMWPGNIRELGNVIERAVLHRKGAEVRPSIFIDWSTQSPGMGKSISFTPEEDRLLPVMPMVEMERRLIRAALDIEKGNYTRSALQLGISLSTFKRKVKKYGLGRGGS